MDTKPIFDFFKEINNVPRPSKSEEKMIQYLNGVARKYNLDCYIDKAGNVIITCPASPGYENAKGVVLQAHMDMVCDKLKTLDFDFNTMPIPVYVDGEWMKSKGTTLGADDGIGVAMALAVAVNPAIKHGPLELLFTTDEESGMTGAIGLEPNVLKGKYLINLDSEDEGEFFIGCAGGETSMATFEFDTCPLESGFFTLKFSIDKFKGGHSGDDINKNRANAIKQMARFVYNCQKKYDLKLISFTGGSLHNAIPRTATTIVAVPSKDKEAIVADWNVLAAQIKDEFHVEEEMAIFEVESVDGKDLRFIQQDVAQKFIAALLIVHNAVLEMNQDIKGLVETSSNLAIVTQTSDTLEVLVSRRSSTESALDYLGEMVAATFELAGAKVVVADKYPGWQPDTHTTILKVSVEAYNKLFNKQPVVRAIHAGLECGLLSQKYPDMEMISFGPTLRDVHTPEERLLIPTVQMTWDLLIEVLDNLK